ncbi:MAG: transposase [Candidatus Kapabacteria bacterium]|nr:transposase [Candidatus Kapabacteria bacterium]
MPRSLIGKTMKYCVRLWDELMAYLHNGHLEIDNNLMENAIRPVAKDRKSSLSAYLMSLPRTSP